MTDSDIKRSIIIDFNKREVNFNMLMSLDDLRSSADSWDLFGKIVKADLPMSEVLSTMSEMVKRAE